jgi:hypothetical protein
MTAGQAALWGAFGGLAVELVEFHRVLRQTGTWPWNIQGEPSASMWLASIVIRIGLGLGLAVAGAETGEIAGPFAAIGAGVAAPLIIEQLGKPPSGHGDADR